MTMKFIVYIFSLRKFIRLELLNTNKLIVINNKTLCYKKFQCLFYIFF